MFQTVADFVAKGKQN